MAKPQEEYLDVLTPTGEKTGISKPRSLVHRDGDYHRAAHVWIYSESTRELLLQRRGDCGKWDISAAGHVSAGESSLSTAMRELEEELGIRLPSDALELLFVFVQQSTYKEMVNYEYDDVYLVTTLAPIPLEAFTLEENKVLSVRYMCIDEYKNALMRGDEGYMPWRVDEPWGQLFTIIEERSCLDKNKATAADFAVKLVTDATRPVLGWKGLEYKVAFSVIKPSWS